jgi:hypothetical protein
VLCPQQCLALDDNALSKLPEGFGNLTNLQTLYLCECKISHIVWLYWSFLWMFWFCLEIGVFVQVILSQLTTICVVPSTMFGFRWQCTEQTAWGIWESDKPANTLFVWVQDITYCLIVLEFSLIVWIVLGDWSICSGGIAKTNNHVCCALKNVCL